MSTADPARDTRRTPVQSFTVGGLIGILGGHVGRGGAKFRLPVLVGWFRFPTLEAVILKQSH